MEGVDETTRKRARLIVGGETGADLVLERRALSFDAGREVELRLRVVRDTGMDGDDLEGSLQDNGETR